MSDSFPMQRWLAPGQGIRLRNPIPGHSRYERGVVVSVADEEHALVRMRVDDGLVEVAYEDLEAT